MLLSISLFTLVFISIFSAWLMAACGFCLSCSSLIGDKFFSLSLMLFGGWIGDLCNGCFAGDFELLGVVHVGVVDSTMFLFGLQYRSYPHYQLVAELVLGKIPPSVVFSVSPETLANHWLPNSPRVFYICCLDLLYSPSVQQRRSCFLPCRSLQFSLFSERMDFFCISPQ